MSPDALVRALGRAAAHDVRRTLLAHAPRASDSDLVRRLHTATMRAARVNLARADRLVCATRLVARRLGDASEQARSQRTAGHILSMRGRHRAALANYRAALDRLVSPEAALERAITLSGALQTLIYLGDYERAHAWAAEARGVFTALDDTLRLGRLDSNVGNVLYRQDRFNEALACYRRAHRVLTEHGTPEDVGIVLRNMAVCLISLNDFPQALDACRRARTWCEQHGMPRVAAETDYNIAYLHYLRGEYARAIELYRGTRAYCRRVGDPYHQALCDLDQSEIYLELNLNDEGERLATSAWRAFRALHMRYEMGKALVNMGAAASRAGEGRRALALFGRAREVFGRERNRHWLMITDLYRAMVFLREEDLRAARRLCRSALAYFHDKGPPGKAVLCELLLGRIAARTGALVDARSTVEHAIARAERGEATALSAEGYYALGEIHEALGDGEAAYAAFRQAHAGLETLRSQLASEPLKVAFLEDKRAVYEGLVSLALQREPEVFRSRVAFRYIEQAKSRSLVDLMAFDPSATGPIAESSSGAIAAQRRELIWWYRKIEARETEGAPGTREGGVADMRQRARDCEARLARAQAEVGQADAELNALGGGQAVPLDAIRATIPSDTALVEYFEARGRILGCVVTRDRIEVRPLCDSGRMRTLLRLVQFQLSKFTFGERYASRFAPALLSATLDHLHECHTALLQPLLSLVDGARHLVIVPHRFLHYLPFHALFDGRQFLLDRVSVSYAPSATVYYLCRTRRASSEPRSLVLGVPDPGAPHILDEVAAVSKVLPNPTVLVGSEATFDHLREQGPGARHIHLATHGLFRQDNPLLSAVRLGSGEISLLDLYQLHLSAELVTLSGCGTGLSAVVGGDELIGLVRGLLYAGARALLVTLWDVNDRSTAAFMGSFYARLREHPDKAQALTAAMQSLRAEYPHPYFWAPFVLIGDAAAA
ncbi:MAG TPA: CHAT domain-containing tetratricopeptide repeat protein [Vicinamibacterales bacterium]|jgi:tetratricopeptide (TPR) repeat protein